MIGLLRKGGIRGTYIVALFLLLCLVLGQVKYALTETVIVTVFCVVCICFCFWLNGRKDVRISGNLFGTFAALLVIITFCIEVYVMNNLPFEWASDPIICRSQAEYMYNVWELRPETADYFYMYPHNVNLILVLGFLYRLLGDYNLVIYVFLLLVNLSSLLTCLTIHNLTGNKIISLLSLLLLQIFCVFTTRTYMPYTSNLAILFPILVMYIYTSKMCSRDKCILIPIVAALAYQAKLTSLIPFIAIVMVEIVRYAMNRQLYTKKEILIGTLSVVLSFAMLSGIKSICWNELGYQRDNYRVKDFAYFLYLGQNTQSGGQWDLERVLQGDFTAPKSERDAYYYSVAKKDFIERGVLGNVKFYVAKTAICWGCTYQDYTRFCGRDNDCIFSLRHCIWFFIFTCAMISIFICRNRYNISMLLTLAGVMLYLFISEGSYTYVIMYSPVVFAMAGITMSSLVCRDFKLCKTHL